MSPRKVARVVRASDHEVLGQGGSDLLDVAIAMTQLALTQAAALATSCWPVEVCMWQPQGRARRLMQLGVTAVLNMSIMTTELARVIMAYRWLEMGCLFLLHAGDLLRLEGDIGMGGNIGTKGVIGTYPLNAQGDLVAGRVESKRAGSMLPWRMELGSLPSSTMASSRVARVHLLAPAPNNGCCKRCSETVEWRVAVHLGLMSAGESFLRGRGAAFEGSNPRAPRLLPPRSPRTRSAATTLEGCRGLPATGLIRCRAWAVGAHRDMSPLLVIVRPSMIAMGTCSHSMPILGTLATTTDLRSVVLRVRSASGAGGGLPSAGGCTPPIAERGLSGSVRA